MKIRSGIILFIYVSIGLMTSNANARSNDVSSKSCINSDITDTTLFNRYISVEPFNLSILPPSSGVQFYKDGIVFLSSTKYDGKMLTDHLSFGTTDTQYAVLKDSVLETPMVFSPSSTFTYPSEAVTFSSDYNTMYFTNYPKAGGGEKIYMAKFSEGNPGVWTFDSNPMSFCSDQSTYTHPALSADGKVMVFSSNRPGSIGGMDLFVSLEKSGTWSDPVNLGDAVNSTYNELYPYLDSENNLFFSSDNIQGFGGYDIYVCKFKGNTWEKPINLSIPVNTRFDDVAFTIDRKDGKTAFYTVKQNSGKRSLQLYQVTMNSTRPDNVLTLSQYFTRPDISQMVILALEPAVQATDKVSETANTKTSESSGGKNIIVYRVQFLTSFNPRTRDQITVSGKEYSVFEYLYSGAYRLFVGEFSTLSPALELQKLLVQDYPRAFVVAFKNNVISLDPELLKGLPGSEPLPVAEKKAVSETETQVKPAVTKAETIKKETPVAEAKKAETVKTETVKAETVKTEPVKPAISQSTAQKDVVVYRVQIFSGGTKGGSTKLTINSKNYMTFEYLYSGGYRTCVGEFSTLNPAKEFQNICRKSGYPQAFVVAFKNNVRTIDPALFK